MDGVLQARVLEWGAIAFSRGSSQPRDRIRVSRIPGRRFNLWAIREVKLLSLVGKPLEHSWWLLLVAKPCLTLMQPRRLWLSRLLYPWDFQVLEQVATSFSRGSSWLRDQTHVFCIGRQILYHLATKEALTWTINILKTILFFIYPK